MQNSGMYNNDKLGSLPIVVPSAIKFAQPKQGPPGKRKEFRLPPEASSYASNSTNIIRFFFNNTGIVDFTRGFLAFDLTLTTPGGTSTYMRVEQGIWNLFNRIRLTTGGELEDMREYGRLHTLIWETHRDPDVGAALGELWGYGTQAQRNTWGATASKDYSMPLLCGLFLTGPLTMGLFTQRLQLELYIENPLNCLETDANVPVVMSFTNVYFHYETLELDTATANSMANAAKSGVRYPFKSYVFYTQPVISAQADLLIPHSSTGIDCFINVMVQNDNMSVTTVNDKKLMWLANGLTTYVLRFNNEFYPWEPVKADDDPQAYIAFLKWIEKWKLGGIYRNPPVIAFTEYQTNKCVIISSLETYPGDGLVNNMSTNEGGNNVFLRIQLNAPPPVPTSMITYVQISKTIDFVGSKLRL